MRTWLALCGSWYSLVLGCCGHMSAVMAVRFRQKQGICCLVEGLPARQVSVVHGIILSKCELRRRTQLYDVCIGTGLMVAIKSNTGNDFPDILSSFRILVCCTSSTNDRNSCSLTFRRLTSTIVDVPHR